MRKNAIIGLLAVVSLILILMISLNRIRIHPKPGDVYMEFTQDIVTIYRVESISGNTIGVTMAFSTGFDTNTLSLLPAAALRRSFFVTNLGKP